MGEEYTTDLSGRPYHPTGHVYLAELGEKTAEPSEKDHRLVWLSVEEFQKTTFLRYQAWAMGAAWELYKKLQKEKKL